VYGAIRSSEHPPDNRLTGHLAETRRLLVQAGADDLVPGIDDELVRRATPLDERLASYRHLIRFRSGNQGTGTNHVVVYGTSVYRVGELLGRAEWVGRAMDLWSRFVEDQEPDGYWAETTPGPTSLYNNLTFCCAGRMAVWTDEGRFHDAAQRGALFHRRFCYPDGCDLETIDGRVR